MEHVPTGELLSTCCAGDRTLELVAAAFRSLGGGGGWLAPGRLRAFAEACGFQGGDVEWEEDYRALCTEYGWSPERGPCARQFAHLVNDFGSGGQCDDGELRRLLRALRGVEPLGEGRMHARWPARWGWPRLAGAVFRELDVGRAGRLGQLQLRRFLGFLGAEGSDAWWEQELAALRLRLGLPQAVA
ncbi:unnamed protein product [Prorocentrum cordatum]|uniref:Calmodulin n=1 Tax=Prorocentrum cordatum TaxID=2364126 RepID=A0ABN9QWK0_9DINO|nr:unnamed protein product [Polarella glacialis]